MLEKVLEYENDFGDVVIFKETVGYSIKYSVKKMPGLYHCCVNNAAKYEDALKHFNRYRGALRRREKKQASK